MANIYDQLRASTAPLLDKFKNPKSQVTLERETLVPDGVGGNTSVWSVVRSFDAVVLPASGAEKLEAQRLNLQVNQKVLTTSEFGAGITAKDRLIFDSRVFNVVFPKNIAEGDIWHSIMCMEGVAT